jgi:hypothetical protein
VVVFSFESSEIVVFGDVKAWSMIPLFDEGEVSHVWTSVVISMPTHWPATVTAAEPSIVPLVGGEFQVAVFSAHAVVTSKTSIWPLTVTLSM